MKKLRKGAYFIASVLGFSAVEVKDTFAWVISGASGPTGYINDPPPPSPPPPNSGGGGGGGRSEEISKGGGSQANENTGGGGASFPEESTPFLTTWNGTAYEFENDFLFGKPDTAFGNYTTGHAAYSAGKTGSDTYILNNNLKVENGKIKLQIREVEPEESFIDRLELYALDVPKGHVPVVDGDLTHLRVFDERETIMPKQSVHLYREKQNKFITSSHFKKDKLSEKGGADILLETGDEILVTIQPQDISLGEETYVYVTSHFRDWTLGTQVPFSALEQFMIKSAALAKRGPVLVASTFLVAGLASGTFDSAAKNLSEVVKVPVVYADKSGKCLFVTAQIDGTQYALQTLFPRFVQASSEVVEIPRELLKKAKDAGAALTLRIKATKRHMVQSAFVFSATDRATELTKKLTLETAIHRQTNTGNTVDAKSITQKDGTYLHTLPADIVDLTYQVPESEAGHQRFFVLKADGFYTKLSYAYRWKYGNSWYKKLDSKSRKLLTRLRIRA